MPDIPINIIPLATSAALTDKVVGVVSGATKDIPLQLIRDLGNNAEINYQTGSYTLQASDHGKVVEMDSATAVTLTVPSGLPAKFACVVIQIGAGLVTFAAGSGTTINGTLAMGGQNTSAYLYQRLTANMFMLLTGGSSSGTTTGGGGTTQLGTPTVSFGATDTSSIVVNWSSVTSATNYVVKRNTSNTITGATQIYSGGLLTFTDTGLTAGTTYYYFVIAQATGFTDSNPGTGSHATSANLTAVTFTNKDAAITESPAGTWGNGATSGVNGVSVQSLAGDGFVQWDVTSNLTNTGATACGFDDNSTKNGYTTPWKFCLYFTGGNYTTQDNSATAVNSGIGVVANDKMRIRRAGTTVYAEVSSDGGTTWNLIKQYTTTSSATLFFKISYPISNTMVVNPKGFGIV